MLARLVVTAYEVIAVTLGAVTSGGCYPVKVGGREYRHDLT